MKMEAGLDTGDMLLKCRRPLPADMTGGELHDLLAADGAQLLSETLGALQAGTLRPQKQDDSQSCYAPMLNKSLSPLDWTKPAAVLHNQVRGLNPWPCATCRLGSRTLKVHRTRVGEACREEPGTIVKTSPFTIACGGGSSLELLEVQAEGSKRMAAADFLRGHPVKAGVLLEAQD